MKAISPCFVLLLSLALVVSTSADIINVPAGQPTIQAGIDAASDGDDLSFLGFFLRCVRKDNATAGFFFCFEPLNDDFVAEWTKLGLGHGVFLSFSLPSWGVIFESGSRYR